MVAAVSAKTPNSKLSSQGVNGNDRLRINVFQNPKRPPLLPSEAENGPAGQPGRPKSRAVTSRYLSSSSSTSTTWSSSNSSNSVTSTPMRSKTAATATTPSVQNSSRPIRRSQSAERRLPTTPSSGEMPNATKLLMSSTRSLSVSFQGQSFSMSMGKAKPAPAENGMSSVRKGTPERRKATPVKDQRENLNSKPTDQQRWPARSRPGNSCFFTRSLDYGSAADKSRLSGSMNVAKEMKKSMIDDKYRNNIETKLDSDTKELELEKKVELVADANSAISAAAADAAASDSDSMSSESTTGLQECGSVSQVRGGPQGIVVPARFWQETSSRIGGRSEPGSPVVRNNGPSVMGASKLVVAKKGLNDSPVSSPRIVSGSRGLSSHLRGVVRPPSPSKVSRPESPGKLLIPSTNSPSRGMPSPIRMRNVAASLPSNTVSLTPSILSFAADMRRGKMGENKIVDAHVLRLLHNRHLQWRFVNARAEDAMIAQTRIAERSLYNARVTASKLRHSVGAKRMELQQLSHNLKLYSILKGQVPYLEDWDVIEREHENSFSEAAEALEASTVRLPVVGGVRVDIQEMENAICSAMDVMQTMASSIFFLLKKVEQVHTLISELASMTTSERALLHQCNDLLSKLTEMEVKDCSLRVHILQLAGLPPCLCQKHKLIPFD